MKLQILVNHYQENEAIIQRFLNSIQKQENIEFEIIIGSDGGNEIPQELLSQYSFPIKYLYLPHSGVCHTRNVLLDKSIADYIMFCDIDDMFYRSYGLDYLYTTAIKTDANIVCSSFLQEELSDTGFVYKEINQDMLHVHGKIFKRQFLIDNQIRFPDEMEFSGDMMFLWLAFALSKNTKWITNSFYIWKYCQNSITRKDKFHSIKTYDKVLQCYTLTAHNLVQRQNYEGLYQNLIATTMSMLYLDATNKNRLNAPQEYINQADLAINKYLEEFFDYYKSLNEKYRRSRYNFMRDGKQLKDLSGPFENIIPWCENRLNKNNILIVGYGVVGQNLSNELKLLNPVIYDKYKYIGFNNINKKYHIAFICVNTPKIENELCDISEVRNAILANDADIYVVKSTVLPGTIDQLIEETHKNIIFSPEYYGETQHANNYDFDYTILGGDSKICSEVVQLLQKIYDGRHKFYITDTKTAELVKYMENSFLATKVSFCQQFFNIAEQIGVNYEQLRELFILDPRVNPSHTFVYRDQPWWDSKCFNKDVPAIAETFEAPLLKNVIDFNEQQKNLHMK